MAAVSWSGPNWKTGTSPSGFRTAGAGIKPEDQASLFTPFFTTKVNGTGLGLVLSQQIITEHKGSIRFESEEGAGATFIVELPLPVAQEVKA